MSEKLGIPHPRLLTQLLSDAEIGEWHAYYTLQGEEMDREIKRARGGR